eukprot:5286828-Prymnesium_polylepis.3
MSNNDLAVNLHFALFNTSAGYLLKPPGMCASNVDADSPTGTRDLDDSYWPPARDVLQRTVIEIISLHSCPKGVVIGACDCHGDCVVDAISHNAAHISPYLWQRGEQRPRFNGSRGACHQFVTELSGQTAPPHKSGVSNPEVSLSVHPIGGTCAYPWHDDGPIFQLLSATLHVLCLSLLAGFCAISSTEYLSQHDTNAEISFGSEKGGMNTTFGVTAYCFAAEPQSTFLRVSVRGDMQELCYETAVLGRLRRGYRVFQLRGLLGTRIELCYLLIHVSFGVQRNVWVTPRQVCLSRLRGGLRVLLTVVWAALRSCVFKGRRKVAGRIRLLSTRSLLSPKTPSSRPSLWRFVN